MPSWPAFLVGFRLLFLIMFILLGPFWKTEINEVLSPPAFTGGFPDPFWLKYSAENVEQGPSYLRPRGFSGQSFQTDRG